jgi:hypothetical protein
MLTRLQTKKMKKASPIVIYGSEYWNKVINLNEMVKWAKSIGFKRPQYLRFLEIDEGKVPKTWTDKLI